MPFLERNNVFQLATDADDPNPPGSANNSKEDIVAQKAVVTYYCPTRRTPVPYGSGRFYRCDYAGNAGYYNDGGINGVVIQTDRATLTIEQIRDGSSNTLMVGEKALNQAAFGTDGGDNERWNNAGWDQDVVRLGGLCDC